MRHGLHTTPPNQACVIVPVVSNANANFGYASFWARSPLPSASLEDDATLCGEGSLRQTATPCVPNLSSKYFRVNSTVCTYVWNLSWLRAKAMLWFRPSMRAKSRLATCTASAQERCVANLQAVPARL